MEIIILPISEILTTIFGVMGFILSAIYWERRRDVMIFGLALFFGITAMFGIANAVNSNQDTILYPLRNIFMLIVIYSLLNKSFYE